MSMIITGGTEGNIEYSCMYDAHNIVPDTTKENLYGFEGIAHLLDDNGEILDDASAILWFNNEMNLVKGEIKKCCENCDYVGRSGGGFFAECLYCGFQVNDETTYCCENFKSKF